MFRQDKLYKHGAQENNFLVDRNEVCGEQNTTDLCAEIAQIVLEEQKSGIKNKSVEQEKKRLRPTNTKKAFFM